MPRKASHHIKKTKTKTKYSSKSSKSIATRLESLLNDISNNRRNLAKSEINLPARLMNSTPHSILNTNPHPQVYSKSISSTFSSTMHNGEIHSAGKEVVNDSTKPFIQVAELHNGHLEKYIIPRNQSNQQSKKSKKSKKSRKSKKSSKSKKSGK